MEESKYLMEVHRGEIRLLAIIGESVTDSWQPAAGDLVRIGNDVWEVVSTAHLLECDADIYQVTQNFVTTADAFFRSVRPRAAS